MFSFKETSHTSARGPSSSAKKKKKIFFCKRFSWYSDRRAPRNTRKRNLRSKIWWFTEFCNSHYVSHFAAFFIVARTKRSIVKSCFKKFFFFVIKTVFRQHKHRGVFFLVRKFEFPQKNSPPFPGKGNNIEKTQKKKQCTLGYGKKRYLDFVDDPSAGSPTETLLRLLLPLNIQVWGTSQHNRAVASSEAPVRTPH